MSSMLQLPEPRADYHKMSPFRTNLKSDIKPQRLILRRCWHQRVSCAFVTT